MLERPWLEAALCWQELFLIWLTHASLTLGFTRMSTDWTQLLHGWKTEYPANWDLIINRGLWTDGYLVLADGRKALLNITWERLKRSPDLDKTLRRLDVNRKIEKGPIP